MSNPSTPRQQNIPMSAAGAQSDALSMHNHSPHCFTVDSELSHPPEDRPPIQQLARHIPRPVYQFMPHLSNQVNPPVDIPYAGRSRDALQHGVSARVNSPTWDIEHEKDTNPHPTTVGAVLPSLPPPGLSRPHVRPVPRPVPSSASSDGPDNYDLFKRHSHTPQSHPGTPFGSITPAQPNAPHPRIGYVPETQLSQGPGYQPDPPTMPYSQSLLNQTIDTSLQPQGAHPTTPAPSQQSTQQEYIWVDSSQPSTGRRPSQPIWVNSSQASLGYHPSQSVDLTGATPPPPVQEKTSKSKRGGSTRGGSARGGSTRGSPRTRGSGRGRGGAKSSKARGKQAVVESLSEGEGESEGTPASKRRRIEAMEGGLSEELRESKAISAEASIHTIEEDLDEAEDDLNEGESPKFSQPENCLAFATAFYSVSSYDYYKSNQSHAYRTISQDVFKGALTPAQLMNGNKNLLRKYKIYEELMEQTGMGTASEEVIQNYLLAQGYEMKARTIQNFGDSEVYSVMHEVLQSDPSVLKLVSLDPSRAISPVGNGGNDGYIGSDSDDSDGVEVIRPATMHPARSWLSTSKAPTTPKATTTSKSRNHAESIIDLDPTTDSTVNHRNNPKHRKQNSLLKKTTPDDFLMATMKESMKLVNEVVMKSQYQQNELFKSQQAMQEAQMERLAAEAKERSNHATREQALSLFKLQQSLYEQQAQRLRSFHDERMIQLKEASMLLDLEAKGANPALLDQMRTRIQRTHESIPWQILLVESANCLRSSDSNLTSLPQSVLDLFPDVNHAQVNSNPPASTHTSSPTLPTSAPEPAPVEQSTDEDYGVAGPGPQTQANILAALGESD